MLIYYLNSRKYHDNNNNYWNYYYDNSISYCCLRAKNPYKRHHNTKYNKRSLCSRNKRYFKLHSSCFSGNSTTTIEPNNNHNTQNDNYNKNYIKNKQLRLLRLLRGIKSNYTSSKFSDLVLIFIISGSLKA